MVAVPRAPGTRDCHAHGLGEVRGPVHLHRISRSRGYKASIHSRSDEVRGGGLRDPPTAAQDPDHQGLEASNRLRVLGHFSGYKKKVSNHDEQQR